MLYKSRYLCLTTNVKCNLNCIYCYEDKSSTASFDLESTKKRLAKFLNSKTETGTLIDLHGGEPFIVFDKIKQLCEWAWNQHFPEDFKFFCTSNGTLIHGEIQDWLRENKTRFICGLSLDGNKQMHDINRSNSFDRIDIDFFISTWPKQGVKMTISPLSINTLAEGIIYLHERGVDDIRANLAEMVNWDDSRLHKVYYRELKKLSNYYLCHPHVKTCSLFSIPFFRLVNSSVPEKWCGIGSMHAYDIRGDKEYPCHLFFESICGKEPSKKSLQIDFSQVDSFVSSECKDCPFLNICPTCYGANYIARGHTSLRDMSQCKMNKLRFAVVADYEYQRITDNSITVDSLSDEEKADRVYTLNAIEKILPALKEIDPNI